MTLMIALVAILGIAALAGWFARSRATSMRGGGGRLHSLPNYHGFHVVIWAAVPALLLLAAWMPFQGEMVYRDVLASPEAQSLPDFAMQRELILAEARDIASGQRDEGFNPESAALAPRFKLAESKYSTLGGALAIFLAIGGAALAFRRVKVDFRARTKVELWMMGLLVGASLIAVLTTLGIVLSLLFESLRFFNLVSPTEFLFGTQWSPQTAMRADQAGSSGAFGSVPLFWGTVFIGAIIAMIVAIPLGLMCAIFLTQYAHATVRAWMKPILEILAGIPTVVYGYFAALTVAPAVRDFGISIGVSSASSESALAAGLVMGIMIIPFVSSMADDFDRRGSAGDARRKPGHGRDQVRNDPQSHPSRGASRRCRRRSSRGQPRDRRNHDRGDGRRPFRQSDRQPVRVGHHRHHADRAIAHRRPGIRQRQDPCRLRARPIAVHHHPDPQPHRAERRAPIPGGV